MLKCYHILKIHGIQAWKYMVFWLMSEEDIELTTIDVEKMNPRERGIFERRMRVLKNKFLPRVPNPMGETRLTVEKLAEKEGVHKDTIEKDITWIKKKYPSLWSIEQTESGLEYTMMEVSGMYSAIIKHLFDKFWETNETDEQTKIANTLNNLMPTYTNSKAHGPILKRVKETTEEKNDQKTD